MREYYYAHIIYDNPGVYDYEYIIDTEYIDQFISEVFDAIKNSYDEIYGSEELNLIDIGGWEYFIEENNIEYNDEDYFPYEAIWAVIEANLKNAMQNNENKDAKFNALNEAVQTYLQIIEDARLAYGEYVFIIKIFRDSFNFAKYFFNYLEETSDRNMVINNLKQRIECINLLISENRFPNNDFHEGILIEWLNIYHTIYEG